MDRISVAALCLGKEGLAAPSKHWARAHRSAHVWLLALAMATLSVTDVLSAPRGKASSQHRSGTIQAQEHKHGSTTKGRAEAKKNTSSHDALIPNIPLPIARPALASLPPSLAAAKRAIELMRQGKSVEATALETSISDPLAQKLVEWALLRQDDGDIGFNRYAAFIRGNPTWPSIPLLRRCAEARLWYDRIDAATARGFFSSEGISSALGRLAYARILKGEGDHQGVERGFRAIWRSAELSSGVEATSVLAFPDELTPADQLARMDRRIGAKDFGAAMRAAKRLGDNEVAIVKACAAAEADSANGGLLLDAVPSEARSDLGYVLCRVHWLLRHDEIMAAAKFVLAASSEDLLSQDTDEWWRERRVLARRLIDLGDAEMAYRVAHEAAVPANPYYRAEFYFMAGWVALRFLTDPATALKHFAHVDEGSDDPIVRARAAYWRGRAAEAAGQFTEMREQYEAAARYPTAYYGQLALAQLGAGAITLPRTSPQPSNESKNDLVRAASIMYAIGERDLVLSFVSDLAQESNEVATLAALGQLAAQNIDAQAMLAIGKTALARGLPMEQYAFPDIGVPAYASIASNIDRCIVYSIVRTESAFNQRDKSPANAVGLMQVTPEAGRDTAKRFHVGYDWDRLVSDPVYNTQMGAAEVAALLNEYRRSYIMTFAGYNAGRGRVREWVAQHGDPRDPKIDAVDWVERIPLAETRNYVQRVMENLQVYRARFGAAIATAEPNLHCAARVESNAEPVPEQ